MDPPKQQRRNPIAIPDEFVGCADGKQVRPANADLAFGIAKITKELDLLSPISYAHAREAANTTERIVSTSCVAAPQKRNLCRVRPAYPRDRTKSQKAQFPSPGLPALLASRP